jgi:hypothetical protein
MVLVRCLASLIYNDDPTIHDVTFRHVISPWLGNGQVSVAMALQGRQH